MAGENIRLKKFLLRAVTVISIIVIIAVGGGTLFMRFYIEPKLGMKKGDMLTMTKYLTDGQMLDNLKNFDKQAAKDVLSTMLEIDADNQTNPEGEPNLEQEVWGDTFTEAAQEIQKADNSGKSDVAGKGNVQSGTKKTNPAPKTAKEFSKQTGVNVPASQQSAYDRIMAAASPEEISAGMAILSKVSLSTVSSYQSKGDTVGLKKYIKSVLTSAEISKALSLYSKYKHLL